MSFIVKSGTLLKELSALAPVIPKNPVIPIINNFLFSLKGNKLTVTASDLHTFLQAEVAVQGDQDIEIAIPAKVLLETLRTLPAQPLTFVVHEASYSLTITTLDGAYRIAGENATDFPPPPPLSDDAHPITLSAPLLRKALKQTIFVASKDELNPILCNIEIALSPTQSVFIATDGHRLARYTHKGIQSATPYKLVLAAKSLQHFSQFIDKESEGEVMIQASSNSAILSAENRRLITHPTSEAYPNWQNVIPSNQTKKLEINTNSLLIALKRISLYANQTTKQVDLIPEATKLKLRAEDTNFSNSADEKIDCTYTGDPIQIGFNAKSLTELLGSLSCEEVSIQLDSPDKAVLLMPTAEDSPEEETLLLIMPLATKK